MKIQIPLALGILATSLAHGQSTAPCDRTCLNGFVDRYLDAVVKHDPKLAPLTKNVKYTENGQRLDPGDGIWRSMVAKGSYRLFVTDTSTGEVAFLGTMREEGRKPGEQVPGVIALRLKVVNGQIPEVEMLISRSDRAALGWEKIGKPDPLFSEAVPPADRMSREDLIKTANMYFSGMQQNDGKGVYPFAEDCNRIENGAPTTNVPPPNGQPKPDPKTSTNYSASWSCREQFESGLLHFVSRIRDRRYAAVDPERGIVFAFAFFDHQAGSTRTFQTPDGRTVTAGPNQPWTWEIAEIFKIEKGKIRRIEATMDHSPYGMNSGWSNWEDGMSTRARDIR